MLHRIHQSQQDLYDYENTPDYRLPEFIEELEGIQSAFPEWPGVEDLVDTQKRRVDD